MSADASDAGRPENEDSGPAGPEVFVLGAGFSLAVSGAMPLTGDLGNAALERSGLAGQPGVPESFDSLIFETWLSRQASPQPYRTAAEDTLARYRYETFAGAVAAVVDDRVQMALASPAPAWLVTFLRVAQARRAVLLTFNYDPLVECGVAAAGITGADGQFSWRQTVVGASPPVVSRGTFEDLEAPRPADGLRLLKLHGSVTWYGVPTDRTGVSLLARLPPGTFGDPRPYDEESRRRDVPGREPFIVPPTASKDGFYSDPLLREVWGQAARALGSARSVTLLGYSLPPTDLVTAGLLQDNLPPGSAVIVADLYPDALTRRLVALGLEPRPAHSGPGCLPDLAAGLAEQQAVSVAADVADWARENPGGRMRLNVGAGHAVIVSASRDGRPGDPHGGRRLAPGGARSQRRRRTGRRDGGGPGRGPGSSGAGHLPLGARAGPAAGAGRRLVL